jgi:hypothetical protein
MVEERVNTIQYQGINTRGQVVGRGEDWSKLRQATLKVWTGTELWTRRLMMTWWRKQDTLGRAMPQRG